MRKWFEKKDPEFIYDERDIRCALEQILINQIDFEVKINAIIEGQEIMTTLSDNVAVLSAAVDKADADIATVIGIVNDESAKITDLSAQLAAALAAAAAQGTPVDPAVVQAITDKLNASVANLDAIIPPAPVAPVVAPVAAAVTPVVSAVADATANAAPAAVVAVTVDPTANAAAPVVTTTVTDPAAAAPVTTTVDTSAPAAVVDPAAAPAAVPAA